MRDAPDSTQKVLAKAVRAVYETHWEELQKVKEGARRTGEEPDSVWEGLVRSAATWGNARPGLDLMRTAQMHDQVRWEALDALSEAKRYTQIMETLKKAKIRWPERKASYLAENFRRIKAAGGPRSVKQHLESLSGAD